MSNNIKLSPLNQKIIQERKAIDQNNTNNNLKLSNNNLKQDIFVKSNKKAITFGSILMGLGLTIGAGFLAYKGKLGSKAQGFAECIVNKFNIASNNVSYEKIESNISFIDLQKITEPEQLIVRKFNSKGILNADTVTYKDIHKKLENPKELECLTDIEKLHKYLNLGIYEELIGYQYTKNTPNYKFLESCRNLNLNSDVNLFPKLIDIPYLTPHKFAIMADNSMRQVGNAYIVDEVPKIFSDLDSKKVMQLLTNFARSNPELEKSYEFIIDGKKISAKFIGNGMMGRVYKLEDASGNSVAMKIFDGRGKIIQNNGAMSEIPLSRQLTKDNVGDVPKFYMANAGMYQLDKDGKVYDDNPWMVTQFIDDKTQTDTTKTTFEQWLECRNMKYWDGEKNQKSKGGFTIDIGGACEKNLDLAKKWNVTGLYGGELSTSPTTLLDRSLKSGMSIEDILATFE